MFMVLCYFPWRLNRTRVSLLATSSTLTKYGPPLVHAINLCSIGYVINTAPKGYSYWLVRICHVLYSGYVISTALEGYSYWLVLLCHVLFSVSWTELHKYANWLAGILSTDHVLSTGFTPSPDAKAKGGRGQQVSRGLRSRWPSWLNESCSDQPSAFRLPWLRISVIFLSCKANARVWDEKSWYGPHSPHPGAAASPRRLKKSQYATGPVWAQNPYSQPSKVFPSPN